MKFARTRTGATMFAAACALMFAGFVASGALAQNTKQYNGFYQTDGTIGDDWFYDVYADITGYQGDDLRLDWGESEVYEGRYDENYNDDWFYDSYASL